MDLTRYGVGARGIDLIERIVNQGAPSVTFPLYDGHGNMTATLSRSGASFTVSNQRSYDAWGGVRSGSTSGFPNTRYVANLGHKQDDESDLIYMRARYYEPWTGRFVSEDPFVDGRNWFAYCGNSPVTGVDPSGYFDLPSLASSLGGLAADLRSASTSVAAKGYVERRILNSLYYHMGYLFGAVMAIDISSAGFGQNPSGYFAQFGGGTLNFDLSNKHGHSVGPHVDFQGGFKEWERILRREIPGFDKVPIGPFIQGFLRGLREQL